MKHPVERWRNSHVVTSLSKIKYILLCVSSLKHVQYWTCPEQPSCNKTCVGNKLQLNYNLFSTWIFKLSAVTQKITPNSYSHVEIENTLDTSRHTNKTPFYVIHSQTQVLKTHNHVCDVMLIENITTKMKSTWLCEFHPLSKRAQRTTKTGMIINYQRRSTRQRIRRVHIHMSCQTHKRPRSLTAVKTSLSANCAVCIAEVIYIQMNLQLI